VNNLGSLLQVSSSLEKKLGGPTFLVRDSSIHFGNRFSEHKLFVFGSVDVDVDADLFVIPTFLNNRYGFSILVPVIKLHSLLREADVLIIHGFYLFSTLLTVLLSNSRTIFLMPHGSMEPYQEHSSRFRKLFFRMIFKSISSRHNIVFLVASSKEVSGVQKLFPQKMIDLAGYGVIMPVGELGLKETPKLHNFVLGSLSRVHPIKRIDLAITSLATLHSMDLYARLIIAGEGNSKLVVELNNLAFKLGLQSSVDFIGSVSDETKEDFFRDIDVLLLLSDNENYAIVVAEAIMRGKPVVVRSTVAMSDFVSQWHTGLTVVGEDPIDIARAVEVVISSYETYSENCLNHRNKLGWSEVAARWEEIITSRMNVENHAT